MNAVSGGIAGEGAALFPSAERERADPGLEL
jgi:hypothetical protein